MWKKHGFWTDNSPSSSHSSMNCCKWILHISEKSSHRKINKFIIGMIFFLHFQHNLHTHGIFTKFHLVYTSILAFIKIGNVNFFHISLHPGYASLHFDNNGFSKFIKWEPTSHFQNVKKNSFPLHFSMDLDAFICATVQIFSINRFQASQLIICLFHLDIVFMIANKIHSHTFNGFFCCCCCAVFSSHIFLVFLRRKRWANIH